MSKKDQEIRATMENILENSSSGQCLKNYFAGLPEKRIRRAISILSGIYPDKTTITDDEFAFVMYMFSDMKFMGQESFSQFVTSVNILNFTEPQKKLLTGAIKDSIEILSETCTFELDTLLAHLFEPNELFRYLEVLVEEGSRAVVQHADYILRHEDFSKNGVSDEKIEALKRKIAKSIGR